MCPNGGRAPAPRHAPTGRTDPITTQTDDRPAAPLAATLERFFSTKTSCDIDGTMSYFAPGLITYTDATLGWDFGSFQALRDVFGQYMPGWKPPARSYATGILSNDVSALDYWDAGPYDNELYVKFRTPDAHFPRDLKDAQVPTQAAPELVAAATALQQAFAAGDAPAAADLLHTDVVLADMSLRTQLTGRIETARYLGRVLANVPYGQSRSLRRGF